MFNNIMILWSFLLMWYQAKGLLRVVTARFFYYEFMLQLFHYDVI